MTDRRTDPDDEWSWATPTPPEELAADRKRALLHVAREYPDFVEDGFTCDTCAHAPLCVMAFDEMNLNGECVMDK